MFHKMMANDFFPSNRYGVAPIILCYMILLVFGGLLFLPGLGDHDLTSSHEARAAQNAQMILDEGHWLVPRLFDRHLELQKPPLYYWLVAALGWARGGQVDAWAVRLPAALSGLACMLFLYFVGVRSNRPLAGFLAGIILASSLHFTWMARVGRIDMPLTMAITFALGAFYLGNREGAAQKSWHVLGYASLGIGLLLKGPIAAVLALVVAFVYSLYARLTRSSPSAPWLTSLLWGVPLTLAIAAPWYVWANWQTDNQLWEVFFWYHNVERGMGGSETLRAHPWWFYGPQAAFDLLPWSIVVPLAAWWFLRKRDVRNEQEAWGGLIWFAVIALFLSCMSFKRADYLLPAYPGMAIFLGICAERWWQQSSLACASGSERKARFALGGTMAAYVIAWSVYNGCYLSEEERSQPYRAIAEEIRRETKGPVVFFRAESHVLMYHIGRPVSTILEWENLEIWTKRPRVVLFVMPAKCADELRKRIPDHGLVEVMRTTHYVNGKRDRLVVLRHQPNSHASIR